MIRAPWRLEVHDELGSTSDLCGERAAAGEPDGLAVLALRQSRARGSRGRDWQSPLGNLALSVLFRDAGLLAEIGWMPLLAGVALIEALSAFVGDPARLSLKWPNDVNLDSAKLAGILIETTACGARADALVVGIGANLAVAPDVPGRRTASLGDAAPAPDAFAPALLDRLWAWRDAPRADVRAAWLARAHPLGSAMRATVAGETLEGAFAGLDEGGRLLLDTGAGRRGISAGEVLLSAAGA
jgi:BirA family biotin operon repressor/biotin-[acetyl-CoA-carboxylase] ligase